MKTLNEIRDILDEMPDDRGVHILDDVVHDICSNMASNINNSGIDEQIAFIKEHLGGEDPARDWLLQLLPSED